MAHKIGLDDTQYEPDICGAVDFSFFDEDDDSDVERTKGLREENPSAVTVVREKRNHSVVVVAPPSSSSSATHLSKNSVTISSQSSSTSPCSSSRFVEDISCGPFQGGLTKEEKEEEQDTGRSDRSRRCLRLAEGQLESGEEMRNEHRASFGSSASERGTAGSTSSLEAHEPHIEASGAVMEEHVDPNHPLHHHHLHHHLDVYTSDEWDEEDSSDLSDTDDDDHSDSSDDDDPKSQVDRLIERGTLMYMDGENSNLSSEESSDYDDTDSESDITDVSPLISATASPLGLSPVLPRRTLGTSPLALHDNRDLAVLDFRHDMIHCHDQGYDSQPHCNGSSHSNSDDSTDMTLLLKAVVELEKKQKSSGSSKGKASSPNNRYSNRRYLKNRTNASHHHHPHYHDNHHHQQEDNLHHHSHHHNQMVDTSSTPIPILPIDASPHHSHLRRPPHHQSSHRRKNMSFSNDEVRRIDRDNQILLKKIMSAHTRSTRSQSSSNHNHNRTVQRPANSTVNRKREDEKIRRENMILLRKIQEAKPSRDVTASRSPRHRTTHGVRPHSSLPATPGSIGASARTA